jgi:hypothetical protein
MKRLLLAAAVTMLGSCGVILGIGSAKPAYAATTITVDCTADSGALASALASASDGDTLMISGTCNGTFEIAHSVTLEGSGGATLDAQKASTTVVQVDAGNTVAITALSITGGFLSGGGACPGGGVANHGMLTLTDSTVSGNPADYGICNDIGATLTVSNSTVSGNGSLFGGAGIFNSGTLTLTGSTITGNQGADGGVGAGIVNSGTLAVTTSTVSGNTGGEFGAGVYNNGTLSVTDSTVSGNTSVFAGDGITNERGTAAVINSTISGNTVLNLQGTMTISSSTVSGNSAAFRTGIANSIGTLTLVNTIVAGQWAGGNCMGLISDGGYNLDDGTTCGFSAANHSLSSVDPLLDPAGLKDNGGPTQTIALQPGSPAIDAIPVGVNGCGTTITSDQRGVSRPQGAGCDIGAFELAQQTVTVKIDIKPGDFPNVIDLGSKGKIPVAVLSTSDFNAPKQVDTASLKFGRSGNESSLASCSPPQDVNKDGLLDVLCHFSAQKTGFQLGDTQGVLTGKTVGGIPIRGTDSVVIVSPS